MLQPFINREEQESERLDELIESKKETKKNPCLRNMYV